LRPIMWQLEFAAWLGVCRPAEPSAGAELSP
jgi:hypothetical protein